MRSQLASERAFAESEAAAAAAALADLQTRYGELAEELRLERERSSTSIHNNSRDDQPEAGPGSECEEGRVRGPSGCHQMVTRADAAVGAEAALLEGSSAQEDRESEQQQKLPQLLDQSFLRELLEHLDRRRPIHEFLATHALPSLHAH